VVTANDLENKAYDIDITANRSTTDPILELSNDTGSLMEGTVDGSFGAYGININITTEYGNGYYVNNTNANAQGQGFMVDYAGVGVPLKVNRYNNVATDDPAVVIYNQTEGSATPPGNPRYGANMYLENLATGSKSTALYVKQGRTMLAYAEAAAGDLSGLGRASVIHVDDGSGNPVTITNLPSDGANGQVLYVTFEDGGSYGAYTAAAGEGLKFVYAGGAWRVIQ
jgi:hypothetical protein